MPGFPKSWQRIAPVTLLLWPVSLLFCLIVGFRDWLYRSGLLSRWSCPVPVIVVGNITVGGTGKTPLVIWLVQQLRAAGFHPGIVTRGYGGASPVWPLEVSMATDPVLAGDEPVLLATRAGCPVVAGPDRRADAEQLLQRGCDVVVSDDGLQHYRLGRDIEIAVIDGPRRFGNGLCLPAGPLREPVRRLQRCDWRVCTGVPQRGELGMRLVRDRIYNLVDPGDNAPADRFNGQRVHAIAGIGNPERFFSDLKASGLQIVPHPFPDHHRFRPEDLKFGDQQPVLMTEKDAVKCRSFAERHHWVVAVSARPDRQLWAGIARKLEERKRGQETA